MTTLVDELRGEIERLQDMCDARRRQLGGANAANARKSQRIRELEEENERLRKLVASDEFGRRLQEKYDNRRESNND